MPSPRLRLVLDVGDGRLGAAIDALGSLAVVVLGVAARGGVDEGQAAVTLVLQPTFPIDLPAIEHVLVGVGCRVAALSETPPNPFALASERVA